MRGKEEEMERTFIQCKVCEAEALVLHCHSTLSPSMTTWAWSGVTLTGSMSEGQRITLKRKKKVTVVDEKSDILVMHNIKATTLKLSQFSKFNFRIAQ